MGLERRAVGDGILMQAAKEVSRSEVGMLEGDDFCFKLCLDPLVDLEFPDGSQRPNALQTQ
jgi:hypothetical protein